jgi:hypothetical protein
MTTNVLMMAVAVEVEGVSLKVEAVQQLLD